MVGAAQMVQTINSVGTTTEWNDAIWGSPAATPTGADVFQSAAGFFSSSVTDIGPSVTGRVRAYGAGSSANPTFLGNALVLVSSTELLLKDTSTTYTANLVLNGGEVRMSPNSGGSMTLSGTINVNANSYLGVAQSSSGNILTVSSTLTGSNTLHLAAGQNTGHTITFDDGTGISLNGFAGILDIGNQTGNWNSAIVDFKQAYLMTNAGLAMGDYASHDVLKLEADITIGSFSFAGSSIAAGTYTAIQLNSLAGNGSQFTGNGSLTVLRAANNSAPSAKVFIIGDSTVLNFSPIVGWGQVIYHYFNHSVRFVDAAYPGESSKTFIADGRWSNVLSQLSTNDYLLIQFGHNDSHNPTNVEATAADGDYKTYLQQYIDQSMAKGAIPVLVTPMHRKSFDPNGNLLSYIVDSTGYTNDLARYAAAMKQVAQSNNLPCVDLFTSSGTYMQQLGNGLCYSNLMYTGDGGSTHFNELGATVMAFLVAQGLSEVLSTPTVPNAKELTQYLRRNVMSQHHADIDKGSFPRPIFTLDPEAGQLRLDWFLQTNSAALNQSANLTTWTPWGSDAMGATGTVSFIPQTNCAFFRLIPR
jgi:lysophospholipase L1-like esterase